MGWDDIKEKTSKFTKIPAGKSVKIHFLGEPVETVVHYVEKKYVPCGDADCAHCRGGAEKIDRFSAQVFNMETKSKQTLEGGVGMLMQFISIRAEYNKDISGLDFKVTRSEGSPAKYMVVPIPTQFRPDMVAKKEPDGEIPF